MFFSRPWEVAHLICHPTQLFCLVGGWRGGWDERQHELSLFTTRPRMCVFVESTLTLHPLLQSPRLVTGSRSGLLKCFVRREQGPAAGGGGGGRRFTFHIGKDAAQPQRSRFLMAAKQASCAYGRGHGGK